MIIKVYEEKDRDDLIFMILQAKDALGRKPTINELNVRGLYTQAPHLLYYGYKNCEFCNLSKKNRT